MDFGFGGRKQGGFGQSLFKSFWVDEFVFRSEGFGCIVVFFGRVGDSLGSKSFCKWRLYIHGFVYSRKDLFFLASFGSKTFVWWSLSLLPLAYLTYFAHIFVSLFRPKPSVSLIFSSTSSPSRSPRSSGSGATALRSSLSLGSRRIASLDRRSVGFPKRVWGGDHHVSFQEEWWDHFFLKEKADLFLERRLVFWGSP